MWWFLCFGVKDYRELRRVTGVHNCWNLQTRASFDRHMCQEPMYWIMASFNPSEYNFFFYLVKILPWNFENTGGNKIYIYVYIFIMSSYIYVYIVLD